MKALVETKDYITGAAVPGQPTGELVFEVETLGGGAVALKWPDSGRYLGVAPDGSWHDEATKVNVWEAQRVNGCILVCAGAGTWRRYRCFLW